jgi:serine/threonine-protein kinase
MGVIHRDLKPENIILVGPPEMAGTRDEAVKLTDFGIAKIVDAPRLTFNEQMFGTPGYIAPEYIEGLPADPRADLYALGVVLYEMVTASLPFEARTQADKLMKPLTTPPIPPRQRVTGLPTELESLILRLLARYPDDRPQDAFAVVDALNDVLRRYASPSAKPPPYEGVGRLLAIPAVPISSPTLVELLGVGAAASAAAPAPAAGPAEGQMTANIGRMPTGEIATRWSGALTELESSIQARRQEPGGRFGAERAAELASLAHEMVKRVERAQRVVAETQAHVDRLEVEGRDFRANLGHAIDVLVHDRSRERAHIEALSARREGMDTASAQALLSVPDTARMAGGIETNAWEKAALASELERAKTVDHDLSFQIEALQGQLDTRNEGFEREMVEAAGELEGSLGALRRLTNELVRTLDEAAVVLGGGGRTADAHAS